MLQFDGNMLSIGVKKWHDGEFNTLIYSQLYKQICECYDFFLKSLNSHFEGRIVIDEGFVSEIKEGLSKGDFNFDEDLSLNYKELAFHLTRRQEQPHFEDVFFMVAGIIYTAHAENFFREHVFSRALILLSHAQKIFGFLKIPSMEFLHPNLAVFKKGRSIKGKINAQLSHAERDPSENLIINFARSQKWSSRKAAAEAAHHCLVKSGAKRIYSVGWVGDRLKSLDNEGLWPRPPSGKKKDCVVQYQRSALEDVLSKFMR